MIGISFNLFEMPCKKGYLASDLQESGTSSDQGIRRATGSFLEFSKNHAGKRSGMSPFLNAVRITAHHRRRGLGPFDGLREQEALPVNDEGLDDPGRPDGPFRERDEGHAQLDREVPDGLHRWGEVAFEARELEVGCVALVSHGRIIREWGVGVKEGNHLWMLLNFFKQLMAFELKENSASARAGL